MFFKDRSDAGRKLAHELSEYAGREDVIILALPRGGVPVAFEVARALDAPLDIFMVRKLGVPGREELAIGAIAQGGTRILNTEVVRLLNISERTIEQVAAREGRELERRDQAYRGDRSYPDLKNKVIILIDDGLATGASMRAALASMRLRDPAKLVVAVPTASPQTCAEFEELVDQIVCLYTPEPFYGVGIWYEDFSQTSDEEVRDLLRQAERCEDRNSK